MFLVGLREKDKKDEDPYNGLYVMKVIPNSFTNHADLSAENRQDRLAQIKNEVECLTNADPVYCNTMVEYFESFAEHAVIIMEYVAGYNLADFRYFHSKTLTES